MNGFGPADIEKSHIKGIFGCIFKQSLMKYGGNKSIKENILRPWVYTYNNMCKCDNIIWSCPKCSRNIIDKTMCEDL